MQATDDMPYTPEIVAAVFEAWPKLRTGAENGVLEISVTEKRDRTTAEKIALAQLGALAPRGKRANNTFYTIDNPLSIILDVDRGMKAVCSTGTISMLYRKFYMGYNYEEIGIMFDMTKSGVQKACQRAFERIAEYLEAPVEKKPIAEMPPRTTTEYPHTRKYAC